MLGASIGALDCCPAQAQTINQYFPAIGTGVGVPVSDTTLARALESYAPTGVAFHDFLVNGEVGEAIGYDSNVDGLPGGVGSTVFDTVGQLSAQSRWSRHQVNAAFTVDDARFPSRAGQDRTNWTATVGGTYDLARDQVGATYTHLNLVQLPTDLGALASANRIPYQVDEGALSYTATTHSPLSFIPGADLTHYQFGSGGAQTTDATGSGAIIGQGYRDRLVVNESLTGRYALSSDNALVTVLRGTEIRYDHPLTSIPGRDSDGFAILTGVDLRDEGPFEYRVLVGYQQRSYESGGYATIRSPIVQAQIGWQPTRLTSLTATIANGIEDSAFENVVGFTATTARLSIQHQYRRNITLGAYADIQQASYPATPASLAGSALVVQQSNQTLFGGGLDLNWLINRHLRLDATYDLSDQNDITGRRFITNEVLLSFHLVL